MLDGAPIAYWVGFLIVVAILIVCDLALLNRGPEKARTRSNLAFVLFLIVLAASFGAWLAQVRGRQAGLEFASGYLIELSLSIDNLFVFLVMFRAFGLGIKEQRKVLLLGIAGAIVMRGLFIFFGIALLNRFEWVQYLFGAFLLVAALRMVREKKPAAGPGKLPGRWMGLSMDKLIQRWSGHPTGVLLSAVAAIELIDLVFALDSIPAVLAVTHDPFVVYTSNIFAVLGLRSLYFLLANLLERLRFLHFGLAAILGFVGCKMLLTRWVHIPVGLSLGFILVVMAIATAASLLYPARESERQEEWK